MRLEDYIDTDLLEKYEFYNYNHALEIITQAFSDEWAEIAGCLRNFEISTDDLRAPGGSESRIPKIFKEAMFPYGWKEIRISGDLYVKLYEKHGGGSSDFSDTPFDEKTLRGFIDGHNIDFIKNRVAFDLEWSSKDQTFDRDLLALRTYYDCDIISAGIIVTKANELNEVFRDVYYFSTGRNSRWQPVKNKYEASTTWMGKLLTRLDSRRNGGCPILAIGMKKKCITDWYEGYIDENSTANE